MDRERIIRLKKVRNCRDLGGLINEEGKKVRKGKLLRSAALADPDKKDLSLLKDTYGLDLVIDLRTAGELSDHPDIVPEGAVYIHSPVFTRMREGVTHEEETKRRHSLPDMRYLYKMMVTEEDCLQNLSKALQLIMTHDFEKGSVLWHCTEGKDRCGLISMFIEMSLGIGRDAVRDDYLMTNLVNKARAERYYRETLVTTGREEMAEAVRDLFLAKDEYIDAVLDVIDERYGGDEAFLKEGLKIPEELILGFREKMLEG